ncbi:hypothetical protein B0H13DRAFT_2307918 [Mycena leptocephala]|nr:hypothetical protein B0H13DRAFT_2307918 [Mycena leptocephala]
MCDNYEPILPAPNWSFVIHASETLCPPGFFLMATDGSSTQVAEYECLPYEVNPAPTFHFAFRIFERRPRRFAPSLFFLFHSSSTINPDVETVIPTQFINLRDRKLTEIVVVEVVDVGIETFFSVAGDEEKELRMQEQDETDEGEDGDRDRNHRYRLGVLWGKSTERQRILHENSSNILNGRMLENPKPERIPALQASRQQTNSKGRTYSRPPVLCFDGQHSYRQYLLANVPDTARLVLASEFRPTYTCCITPTSLAKMKN